MIGTAPATVKERRIAAGLGRNAVAARATMGARVLSLIEDGQMRITPQIEARIDMAIESLQSEAIAP